MKIVSMPSTTAVDALVPCRVQQYLVVSADPVGGVLQVGDALPARIEDSEGGARRARAEHQRQRCLQMTDDSGRQDLENPWDDDVAEHE